MKRFVFLAAALVVIAVIWFAVSPRNVNNAGLSAADSAQEADAPLVSPAVKTVASAPARFGMEFTLQLNKISAILSVTPAIDENFFWYELTYEQRRDVFPPFPFSNTAAVYYREDGSLYDVTAYTTPTFMENENYVNATSVKLSPNEIARDYVIDTEPVESYVNGVPVIAGAYESAYLYTATFELDRIYYAVEVSDNKRGLKRLTDTVNAIIAKGAPDLSVFDNPVIPELRNVELTLEEARQDPDFGRYIPNNIPPVFANHFESARRFINQENNYLSGIWGRNYDYLNWEVGALSNYERACIVDTAKPEQYDLSLYPNRADVPDNVRQMLDNPVFMSSGLTLELIKTRAYYVDGDRGDTPGWRMDFGVLINDVVVKLRSKGLTAEEVWAMYEDINHPDFWNYLTDEQYAALFPAFSFPVEATVQYNGDKSVRSVDVRKRGLAAMEAGLYKATFITLSPNEIEEVFSHDFSGMEHRYIDRMELGGIHYRVEVRDDVNGPEQLAEIMKAIKDNGAPDLSVLDNPIAPEYRNEEMTLESARLDSDFGRYIPQNIPARFADKFESSNRRADLTVNGLANVWRDNRYFLHWFVGEIGRFDHETMVSADEREEYDISSYDGAEWQKYIPLESWEIASQPIFKAEELTLEMINARARAAHTLSSYFEPAINTMITAQGSEISIYFGFVLDDVVIKIVSLGVSPEEIWAMCEEIINS